MDIIYDMEHTSVVTITRSMYSMYSMYSVLQRATVKKFYVVNIDKTILSSHPNVRTAFI